MPGMTIANDPSAPANAATYAPQGRLDKVDIDIMTAAVAGTVVASGCAVTPNSSGVNRNINVAAGSVRISSAAIVVPAAVNVAIAAADALNPRRDLVTVTSTGATAVITGIPAALPAIPNVPAGSIAIAVVDLPAGATSITALNITDKRELQSLIPSLAISRLMIGGDSRSASPDVAAGFTSNMGVNALLGASTPMRNWAALVRDMCGVDPSVWKAVVLPVTSPATDLSSPLGVLDVESIVAEVTYTTTTPLGAGNATNYRFFRGNLTLSGSTVPFFVRSNDGTFLSGTFQGVELVLFSNYKFDTSGTLFIASFQPGDPKQYQPPGGLLVFESVHVGTGQTDPGGIVTVRLFGRYANMAVNGARLSLSSNAGAPTSGGWSTWAQFQQRSRPLGAQMKATVAYPGSGTAITVDQVPFALVVGDTITFSGGTTLVVNAAQASATAATALTVTVNAGTVAVGEVGTLKKAQATNHITYGYPQSNVAINGLCVLWWGTNDVGNSGVAEISAWKHAMRYAIAIACCPYRQYGFGTLPGYNQDNTIVTNNGNGSAGWSLVADANAWCSRPSHLRLTGSTSLGTTKPTLTVTIPSWYDGIGAICLFFASKNTQLGGTATITYGQGQAAATALFSGANAGFGIKVNGGATPGTNDAIDTGFAAAITTQGSQGVGMCLRVTGLPAGGGTIVVTVTALFSAASEFIFDLWGVEAVSPSQPVIVIGCPYQPSNQAAPNGVYPLAVSAANVDTFNTATKGVIAERAEAPANVVFLDINPLLNATPGGAADPTYYAEDGVHLNDKGDSVLAAAVMLTSGLSFTPAQLACR